MMKKFLMVALMLCISTATFAGEGNIITSEIDKSSHNVEINYDFNVNYNKLSEYLKLNDRNFQKVKNAHDSFCEEMLIASKTNNIRSSSRYSMQRSIIKVFQQTQIFLNNFQYAYCLNKKSLVYLH